MPIRRTNRQILLDEITNLTEEGKNFVPNRQVMETLNWDEERYWHIRQDLIDDGVLIVRRGLGGTVNLAKGPAVKEEGNVGDNSAKVSPLSLFISYSHSDANYMHELNRHLAPIKRAGFVQSWNDISIIAGSDFDETIAEKLRNAHIVVLLISADFLDSFYCYDVELESALDRRSAGDATVVPIILRNCIWRETPLRSIQALPKDGRPVVSWESRDDAWTNVVEGLVLAIKEFRSRS